MKEKTFKDLGLDDGDKYLEQMAGVLDLAYLEDILNEKDDEEKLEKKKMYMQFYESSYFLLARKSIRYPQQRQYQKLGIIVYLFTNRIPTFRCVT